MTKALLIIDAQIGVFINPRFELFEGERVVANIKILLDKARKAGAPIIYVKQNGWGGTVLEVGHKGHEIIPDLTPHEGEVVFNKDRISCFTNPDLVPYLHEHGIESFVVCGFQSEYCIDSAVRTGSDMGFDVTLAEDAHSTFETKNIKAEHIIELQNRILGIGFGKITKTKDIEF